MPAQAGYFLSGFSAVLLLGRSLTVAALRPIAIKLVALLLVILLALVAYKLVGDRFGLLVGWLAAAGVVCFGLLILGVVN
jgi:hypothetical protein